MITENLSTLKLHKLTQAQYDRELEAGRIDESAMYLTPDDETNNEEDGYIPVSRLICYSETIKSILSSGSTNGTHVITKTWSNGIPIVKNVSYDGKCPEPIIYTVSECDICNELRIRVQRPTGVATNTEINYALQLDVIGI